MMLALVIFKAKDSNHNNLRRDRAGNLVQQLRPTAKRCRHRQRRPAAERPLPSTEKVTLGLRQFLFRRVGIGEGLKGHCESARATRRNETGYAAGEGLASPVANRSSDASSPTGF